MSQKVDPKTGTVIDWQPPAPPADESQSWRWDATARRWWPVPTSKALATAARAERARLLAACDWVPLRAVELGQAVPSAWAAYRKALREVPAQIGFPHAVDWPVPP